MAEPETYAQSRKTDFENRDKKWEQVQIKAFKQWVNSTLKKKGLSEVEDLKTDLSDGVKLILFLEDVTGKRLGRYDKNPQLEIQKIQNCGLALKFVTEQLQVRLVGIGAEDIVQGEMKLILGLLWSLFRKLRIQTISEEGKQAEDGLLAWIKKTTDGYRDVNITNFRESFNDGMAFSALVHAFNNELVDYDSLDKSNAEDNLTKAFEIAEKEMGIPQLLDVSDFLAGNPDERSVTLYCSLFFHAFTSDEARKRIEAQKSKITNEMTSLKTQLSEVQEERDGLKMENERLASEQEELKRLLQEKDDLLQKLLEEIEFLKSLAQNNAEAANLLEDKVETLAGVLEQERVDKDSSEELRNRLRKQLETLKKKNDVIEDSNKSLEEKLRDLLTDAEERARLLKDMESKRDDLLKEIERLAAQVQEERAARAAKSKEILELKQQLESLNKRVITHGKANYALDVLRKTLEEHLEELYKFRALHHLETGDDNVDRQTLVGDIKDKSFEEQVSDLSDGLHAENSNLLRIIKLTDSQYKLKGTVTKAGWLFMKGRKDWKKRWFVLRSDALYYYENPETSARYEGFIDLNKSCEVVRQKAIKEDDSAKKLWPLKITVGERKLFVRAATKKERHSWYLFLASKIAELNYLKSVESSDARADIRLLSLFSSETVPTLYLDNRQLPEFATSALARVLTAHDETTVLSLANASMGDESAKNIADVFEKLSVTVLNLSNNQLTASTAALLAERIGNQTNLAELDLSKNSFDDASGAQLIEAASKGSCSVIDLSDNQVGNATAQAFASAFTEKAVSKIQLGKNQIGDEGASAVAKLLVANSTVGEVDLSNNNIGDAGARDLAAALKENKSVAILNLSGNDIGPDGADALREALEKNVDVQKIDLSNNSKLKGGEVEGLPRIYGTVYVKGGRAFVVHE